MNFQNTLEQEGGIPEELDRCINMMGMRFKVYLATLMDVYLRHQLIQNGSIDDFYIFIKWKLEVKVFQLPKRSTKKSASA